MLDLHPDVMVVVPGNDGPQLKPIRKLLPDTYFFPDADSRRILRFNKRYYDVAEQARLAPGTPVNGPPQGLRSHYPDLPDEAEVEVVTFKLQSFKNLGEHF